MIPVPPSKVFVHVNPIQINFDTPSILWMHSFTLNLRESINFTNLSSPTQSIGSKSQSSSSPPLSARTENNSQAIQEPSGNKFGSNRMSLSDERNSMTMEDTSTQPNIMYMDVKLEAIMPRVLIELPGDVPHQKDRPKCMQIQISRLALTNTREVGSTRADLAQAIHSLQEGSLVFGHGFPSTNNDMCIITDRILSHIAATDNLRPGATSSPPHSECLAEDGVQSVSKSVSLDYLNRYAMWSEPRDIWCINFDPIWIDFLGARSLGTNKSIPFIDAVPMTLWLYTGHRYPSAKSNDGVGTFSGKMRETLANVRPPNTESYVNNSKSETSYHRNPFIDSEEDIRFSRRSQTPSTVTETTADLHAIVHISNLVSIQLDHYQYLFLLRLAEEFTEMSSFLALDAERIPQKVKNFLSRLSLMKSSRKITDFSEWISE